MNNTKLLTPSQVASVLQINENALDMLVRNGQIPHTTISTKHGNFVRFNPHLVESSLQNMLPVDIDEKKYLECLRKRYATKYPKAIQTLKKLSQHFVEPRKPKGYSLHKVTNKKTGFVYYVRYIVDGQLLRTRWSTHTNNVSLAEQFAIENRERLIAEYLQKKNLDKPLPSPVAFMKKYYEKNSPCLIIDARRGRKIGERTRQVYHNTIIKHWIPYLKKQGVKTIAEIDTPFMARFQNYCLNKGIKPQTVNHYVSYINQIFSYLHREGNIKINPCVSLSAIRVSEDKYEQRGCYEIKLLQGVFNKRWNDELSYLLCLVIYSTGMRNIEIDQMRVRDIIEIDKVHYIDIPKSKTKNGVRIIPLHDFVYKKLCRYIRKNGKSPDTLIFCQENGKALSRKRYTEAYIDLGRFTGYTQEQMREEHISFYSGRHFWKTFMNAHNLGDVEEYFMGHKVSGDVAKRYNHRDKQGQKAISKKARDVIDILDRYLFKSAAKS
jgi:integrase